MFADVLQWLTDASLYAYLVVFVIGFGWILIGMLLGGLHSMVDFAHDLASGDVGNTDHEVGISPLSPLMLAVFGMVFGVTGMGLTLYTGWHVLLVLLATSAFAILFDFGFYKVLYGYFVEAQASSLPRPSDAIGSLATVATRVAPDRTGTINYEAAGRLQVAGARATDGTTLEPGTVVRIRSLQGGVALVQKTTMEDQA